MRYFQLGVLIVLLCVATTAFAQDTLNIYGDGFAFKVAEPQNMPGYTADAYKYRVNAYFCLPKYNFNNSPVVMYIRVLPKDGLSVEQHLEADMEGFKIRYNVSFSEWEITGMDYKYSAKKYLIANKDADYLCYVDPGDSSSKYVIFVLSGPKDQSENYFSNFQKLVQSFLWLGNNVAVK